MSIGTAVSRIRWQWRQKGPWDTLLAITRTLAHPFIRHRRRLIWEADLTLPLAPSDWASGERLVILGPGNVDAAMTPPLRSFLGGAGTASEIEGVRNGDRLFVVDDGKEYVACSYIFFDVTKETRRQARILRETRNTPIIGLSYTAPSARGRGLYKRVLNEMFRFLQTMGYERAVCEVEVQNLPSNRASQAAGMHVCRELADWTIAKCLMVQRVREPGTSYWRVLWV